MENQNKQSKSYTLGYDQGIVEGLNTRSMSREGRFFLPYLQRGMQVLDAGCGPGSITLSLAKFIQPGRIVGIDIDEGQVKKARQTANLLKIDKADFQVADVYHLPFEDEEFDAVFAHTLFMHLEDPKKALLELSRVTKKGGGIGIRDGLGAFEHLPQMALPEKYNNVGQFYVELMRKAGASPLIGIQIHGLLQELGYSLLKENVYSEIYKSKEELEVMTNWYKNTLSGHFGRLSIQQNLLTPLELERLIASLDRLPSDPASISVSCWIEYVAQKKEQES